MSSKFTEQVVRVKSMFINGPEWPMTGIGRLPLAKEIALADYHDEAIHDLSSVKAAYYHFKDRLLCQYAALRSAGFTFSPLPASSPSVNSSRALFERLDSSGKMSFFRTDKGFGSGAPDTSHPMLRSAGTTLDNYNLCYNDIFRIVHDLLGHYTIRSSFSPLGEYKAFLSHLQTFGVTNIASQALMLETIIQSSWFAAGTHIRRPDNSLPERKDPDFIPFSKRPFAESKIYRPLVSAVELLPMSILEFSLFGGPVDNNEG